MSVTTQTALVALVEQYDATGTPTTARAVADRVGADEASVADRLDALVVVDFLAEADDGYRPTVTAREFLALDVELGDVLAVDVVDG